jgi:hypothetical protein
MPSTWRQQKKIYTHTEIQQKIIFYILIWKTITYIKMQFVSFNVIEFQMSPLNNDGYIWLFYQKPQIDFVSQHLYSEKKTLFRILLYNM